MINIYRNNDSFKGDEIIIDNEAFFNNNISAKMFGKESIDVMQVIDNAHLLNENNGKIETPYGLAGIRDLSTGCKTILNYIFIKEHPDKYPNIKAIDATECGWNALDKLFEVVEKRKDEQIIIVVQHDNDLYKCSDREYCIDGKNKIQSLYDF